MKNYILYTALFLTILSGTIVSLLYFGILWPNNPDRSTYPVQGIDVSHHQGKIDWSKVKEDRIDFAFIKATEGGDFVDKNFHTNWQEAAKNHISAGAYHFFTLCRSGKDQAANFISVVPVSENSLPPVIDLEFTGNCSSRPENFHFETELDIFYNAIMEHYKTKPIIYTTYEFYEIYDFKKHTERLWMRDIFKEPSPEFQWIFWQYSNREHISGIEGYVDGNVFKGSREEFQKLIE